MKRFGLALCLITCLFAGSLSAVPGQVIIIRHAEKGADGNLSKKGLERAGALAAYFTETASLLKFGEPVAIFAARPTPNTPPFHADENTERCLQTVGPTSQLLKQPIHPGYDKLQVDQLADFILNNEDYDGRNVIICWHHDNIQDLAIALGFAAAPVFHDVYDITWVLTFSPTVQLDIRHQRLLFGDTP